MPTENKEKHLTLEERRFCTTKFLSASHVFTHEFTIALHQF